MPTINEYSILIMNEGNRAFKSLSNLEFIPAKATPFKIMSFGSGAFAAVFKAKQNGKVFAIRCFLNTSTEKIERYKKISTHLSAIATRWKVDFELLENEIYIDNQSLPILKMEWINGIPINEYIDKIINDYSALTNLQKKLFTLNNNLEINSIGHGDLQHGNILVIENNDNIYLKLVDYDGMYVPELKDYPGIESGMKAYQHPKRTKMDFNAQIDRFSIWVMVTAIEAIKYDKGLWRLKKDGGYNTTDNFLFQGNDFLSPNQSELINRLLIMPQESVKQYAQQLKENCLLNINTIPFPKLFPGEIPAPPPNDNISIFTNPTGITVQNALFQNIGITPLVLDKVKYLNNSIRLIHNDKVKNVSITNATTIINIDFIGTIPTPPPVIPKPNPIEDKVSHDTESLMMLISIIAILIIIIIAVAVNATSKDTNVTTTPPIEDVKPLENPAGAKTEKDESSKQVKPTVDLLPTSLYGDNEVKGIIQNYYNMNNAYNLIGIVNCFSDSIKVYFNSNNISKSEVEKGINAYWNTIYSHRNEVDYNSISISREDGNYILTVPLTYYYTTLKDKEMYSKKIESIIKLNSYGKIYYINQIRNEGKIYLGIDTTSNKFN